MRRLIFVLVFGNGLHICNPQNRSCVFRYMVKFSKYDVLHKKNDFWGVDFIFLISLGNDINRILTSQMTALKYTLCTLTWRKNHKDIYNNFLSWIHLIFPFLIQNEIGKIWVWRYPGAFQTLSIASVISNQCIATKLCISIEQIPLSTFPLS